MVKARSWRVSSRFERPSGRTVIKQMIFPGRSFIFIFWFNIVCPFYTLHKTRDHQPVHAAMVRLSANWLLWAAYMMRPSAAVDSSQKPLSTESSIENDDCLPSQYKIHIFSKSPVVIYIENFISDAERQHLQDLAYAPRQLSA